jgi:hypothetical protein
MKKLKTVDTCGVEGSNQTLLGHGQSLALANDHMVKHPHIHQSQRGFERLSQSLVSPAGLH